MGLQFDILYALIILSILASLKLFCHAEQVPCYFVFGDSLEDNGNNLNLISLAKGNYFPYGIDYPSGPTGRFTNGRTVTDFIAEYLGFEDPIPPFANTGGSDMLKGVKYASAAAGIRSESGIYSGDRLSFNRQLQNHASTVSQISTLLGKNTTNYLSKCLYSVGMGSNDYFSNYLMPILYDTSKQYNPTEYAKVLILQYTQQLKTLYNYGARKIAISGIGQIGCVPVELATSPSHRCSEKTNYDIQLFNAMLPPLVDSLNRDLVNARFIYINVFHIMQTEFPLPGVTHPHIPCCVVSATGLCIPHIIPCKNRTAYAYFDAIHPTEYFYKLLAERAYSARTQLDSYPYDISSLAKLRL